jgi:hypothetical protein
MTDTPSFFSNQGEFIAPRSLILDRLNFWHTNKGLRAYYDLPEFEKALETFQNLPIIYAMKHPDPELVLSDLDAAIKSVDGKLAGYAKNIFISNTGSPKLQGDVEIIDSEVNEMISNGEIYVSNAFQGFIPDPVEKVIRSITGNHILLYPSSSMIPPGDQIATFLNQGDGPEQVPEPPEKRQVVTMTDPLPATTPSIEFFANQYEEKVEKIASLKAENDAQAVTIANQGQKIASLEETVNKLSEASELVKTQKVTIENQASENEKLTKTVEELNKKLLSVERQAFLNQFSAGTLKEFEARLSEYDDLATRSGLVNAMWKSESKVEVPPTTPSGAQVVVENQGTEENKDDEATKKAWDESNRRF